MKTVYTEAELKEAFAAKEEKIIVKGAMAETMIKKSKTKKASKIGGIALVAASLAALPTFGASVVAGLTAMGATLVLSAGELAILCGFALGVYGISKGSKVDYKVTKDGPEVTIEPTYK